MNLAEVEVECDFHLASPVLGFALLGNWAG